MKKFLFLTLLLSAIGMKGWAEQYPNVLYAVGDATSTVWTAGGNNILYKYSGEKKYQGFVSFTSTSGELKFLCQKAWGDMWGATSNGDGVSTDTPNTIVYHGGGSDDFKFKPTFATGLYLVTIDATTVGSETVTFKLWNNSTDVYEIGNAAQLHAFANCVNNFCTTLKGKLTADINMTGEGWTPIGGDGHKYCGTFDGQGHMIDHLVLDNSGYDSQGIFGQVGGSIDADECIIKNLIAGPNNSIKGSKFVGGLIGCADGSGTIKLINCGQEGYVEAVNENAAAMIGCMKSCALYLENCYNIGNIKGDKESAIISGWLAGHKYHTISGFYNTGSIENGQDGDHSLFRNQDGGNNWADIPYSEFSKYENVYHIYANQGATQVTKDADNYYQIGDGKQLKWFAYWTRTGSNTNAKGMLTANIDMSDIDFPCIGSDSKKFAGELVGDGAKIISNLTINENGNDVGLIRVATDGAQVKNITTDFTCSFKGGSQVGAIIGTLNGGGDVYVENCGNEAPVEAANYNAGGLVGKAFSSTIGHFTNCYNVGGVKSGIPANAAGLTYNTDGAVFTNCYSYLNENDCYGLNDNKWFTNTDNYTATNCYGNNSSSNSNIAGLSADGMADGTLKTNLGDAYTNMVYGTKAHPGFAAQINIELREDAVNTLPNENMTSMNVKLYRTLVGNTWNSICLPFNLDDDGVISVFGENTKLAEFTSVNGANNDNMHFDLVTSISAKKPYLIYPHDNRDINTPIVLSGITIQVNPETVSYDPFNFIGIYSPTAIDGKYFIASGNTIKKSTGGNLKAFRAYIEDTTAESRTLTFDCDDSQVTEISTIANSPKFNTNSLIYDLQGRKVMNPTKGMYIVNGKKVVVK